MVCSTCGSDSSKTVVDVVGFVFVSVPPPKGEKYAFSVPVSSLYSILVYPVSTVLIAD